LIDTYFRIFSGNTQVNATELRQLPLPPLKTIIQLGRDCRAADANIDALIAEMVGVYA
jgi:adenine-specific DNA-methyltransferase